MPASALGQMISFLVEQDSAETKAHYVWIRALKGDTIRKIATRRGLGLKEAKEIAQLNKIRSLTAVLKTNRLLKLPGTMSKKNVLHMLADDPPPTITAGYAKFTVVNRPGTKGISQFAGYDPAVYDVPVQFESFTSGNGAQNEVDIQTLERMAGRGNFPGSSVGPPSVIRISVTDNSGNPVWLIPTNFQWSPGNAGAPLWRISNITWDKSPKRDQRGQRTRQKAVVAVTEYTPISVALKSAAARAKAKPAPSGGAGLAPPPKRHSKAK